MITRKDSFRFIAKHAAVTCFLKCAHMMPVVAALVDIMPGHYYDGKDGMVMSSRTALVHAFFEQAGKLTDAWIGHGDPLLCPHFSQGKISLLSSSALEMYYTET